MGEIFDNFEKKQRLSQQEIADYLEISQSTISLWESDKSTPQVEYLPKLAEILKVNILELLPKTPIKIEHNTDNKNNLVKGFDITIDGSQLFKDLLDSKDEIIRLQRDEIQRLKGELHS